MPRTVVKRADATSLGQARIVGIGSPVAHRTAFAPFVSAAGQVIHLEADQGASMTGSGPS
jgi:hypothetical protein